MLLLLLAKTRCRRQAWIKYGTKLLQFKPLHLLVGDSCHRAAFETGSNGGTHAVTFHHGRGDLRSALYRRSILGGI
jgi:hypothetical protein